MDMSSEGEVESINYCGFGNDSGVVIIGGSIDLIIARESVSGSEFSTREDLPNNIKIL